MSMSRQERGSSFPMKSLNQKSKVPTEENEKARVYNFLGAAPLILWYGLGLLQGIPIVIEQYHAISSTGHIEILFVLQTLAQVSGMAFTAFLVVLLVVRTVPVTVAQGFIPRMAAIIGTFATVSFFHLPHALISIPLLFTATACILTGFSLCLYTLIYLGSSFAIMPAARRLVTDGPYRFVRHPLYLCEEIAIIGIMIQFIQPWSALMLVAHFAVQLTRMHYEEETLTNIFPEYAAYAAHTARLLPGIY